MQSPWTRDGKIRAEQVDITPQVSGSILALTLGDNQFVKAGDILFQIDPTPWRIAVMNAGCKADESTTQDLSAQVMKQLVAEGYRLISSQRKIWMRPIWR